MFTRYAIANKCKYKTLCFKFITKNIQKVKKRKKEINSRSCHSILHLDRIYQSDRALKCFISITVCHSVTIFRLQQDLYVKLPRPSYNFDYSLRDFNSRINVNILIALSSPLSKSLKWLLWFNDVVRFKYVKPHLTNMF